MTKIKIISNPYDTTLFYQVHKQNDIWEDVTMDSLNSRLRENSLNKDFLPFQIQNIIETVVYEYYVGNEPLQIIFEGTKDEYEEVYNICQNNSFRDKVTLTHSARVLADADTVLKKAKSAFYMVHPIIKNMISDDTEIASRLDKVSDALKNIVPVCVFGNYSAGKSTFINSLIGYEILPSGGQPVTAKVFEIKRGKQLNQAKVFFSFKGENHQIAFEEDNWWIVEGDKYSDLTERFEERISELEEPKMHTLVNSVISVLNSFKKNKDAVNQIGDVIKIEIPFSTQGILGRSSNQYVIFDTPGSNSNTNLDHEKILRNAMQSFSNGIPIWVTNYESMDSTDNAKLCDFLLQIEALDKRFTMIAVNKADQADLPKKGFTEKDICNIMEYDTVEKIYAGGIYFTSAAVGLCAKNLEGVHSEFLYDLFDEKKRQFSDPNARSYKKLYEYNIMPAQMKERAVAEALACDNVIYANSGLYCIESAIARFADKYAAYNKCQMVYLFLKQVVTKVKEIIDMREADLTQRKSHLEQDLQSKKENLQKSMQTETQTVITQFQTQSSETVKEYVEQNLIYTITQEDLDSAVQQFSKIEKENTDFQSKQNELDSLQNERADKFSTDFRTMLQGNIFKNAQKTLSRLASNTKDIMQKKSEIHSVMKSVDKTAADNLIQSVMDTYRCSMEKAQDKLWQKTKEYWQECAKKYRDAMIKLIMGSDALSNKKRDELSALINNYPVIQYDDKTSKIFIKEKFLQGNILGLQIIDTERLNTARLAAKYNKEIQLNIKEIADDINKNCENTFMLWQKSLQNTIYENITSYNPNLHEITLMIQEETERIEKIQADREKILGSLQLIEESMSWKDFE